MRLFAILFAVLPCGTLAEGIVATPYAEAVQSLTSVVDFENPPFQRKRFVETQPLQEACATFGEAFMGQRIRTVEIFGDSFDSIGGKPSSPLALAPPSMLWFLTREQLSHGRSVALLGNGPKGADKQAGVGEGAIAILFDIPQSAVAFTYDTHSPDVKQRRGTMVLRFFDAEGRQLGFRRERLGRRGDVAFRTQNSQFDIKGILITNIDPGGIAIDDVHMRCDTLPMS